MKTFNEVLQQFKNRVHTTTPKVRFIRSLGFILYLITLIMLELPILMVGLLMAGASVYMQYREELWDTPEDYKWMAIVGTWYTLLYTAVAAIFI